MIYIFNQKQQKVFEVLLSTYRQLAEAMPDNEARKEILRVMYRETYLPLLKNASVKVSSVVRAQLMSDIVSYYYRGDFSKPFVDYWVRGWTVVATKDTIYFKRGNEEQIKYALNTFDVDPATKQLPKWCRDLVRMVQAMGTKSSCVALEVKDRYRVLNSKTNFIYQCLSEDEFVEAFLESL